MTRMPGDDSLPAHACCRIGSSRLCPATHVLRIVFASEDTLITEARDATRVWDLRTQKLVASWPTPEQRFLAWNETPFEKIQLFYGNLEPAIVRDALTGKTLCELADSTSTSWSIHEIAYNPVMKLVAAGCTDGEIACWSVRTGKLVARYKGHAGFISGLAYSPHGRVLASWTKDRLRLWKSGTENLLWEYESAAEAGVVGAVFSPDSRSLALGQCERSVIFLDVASGKVDHTKSCPEATGRMAYSPDGRLLVVAPDDGVVRAWDLGTGTSRALECPDLLARAFAFSPSGHTLAAILGEQQIALWDFQS
jgi:WD40 repeat protein